MAVVEAAVACDFLSDETGLFELVCFAFQFYLSHNLVLVRIETSPEDLAGMASAEGILTARGGMTSHAAVVARGMGNLSRLQQRYRYFLGKALQLLGLWHRHSFC